MTTPESPRRGKRPADEVGLARHVARIAPGEIDDTVEGGRKDTATQHLGRWGRARRVTTSNAGACPREGVARVIEIAVDLAVPCNYTKVCYLSPADACR